MTLKPIAVAALLALASCRTPAEYTQDRVAAAELHLSQRLERIEQQQALILSAIRDGKVIVLKETRR